MVLCNGKGGLPCLLIIGRDHNGHVGKHVHHANVLKNLVGRPVFSKGQSGMRSANLDVLFAVCDALANLIVHTPSGEIGKGPSEWNLSTDGHASRQPHHVGLGNANLEEPVGKGVLEGIHFQGACEVGTESHDIVIAFAGFEQTLAKA